MDQTTRQVGGVYRCVVAEFCSGCRERASIMKRCWSASSARLRPRRAPLRTASASGAYCGRPSRSSTPAAGSWPRSIRTGT